MSSWNGSSTENIALTLFIHQVSSIANKIIQFDRANITACFDNYTGELSTWNDLFATDTLESFDIPGTDCSSSHKHDRIGRLDE